MTVSITVLYPNDSDVTFDMKYYLSTHMPLVQSRWGPHGLTDWHITKFDGEAGDKDVPYCVEAKLAFESPEAFEAAKTKEGEEVFGDIKNFCNKSPTVCVGTLVKSKE